MMHEMAPGSRGRVGMMRWKIPFLLATYTLTSNECFCTMIHVYFKSILSAVCAQLLREISHFKLSLNHLITIVRSLEEL
jgi:hypothetical protein